jgi:predicted nucleic acid-binding protein
MILTDANLWVALYDDRDASHAESLIFFRRIFARQMPLHAPAILLVEVACSISRRSRSEATGKAVTEKLKTYPLLTLWPLDETMIKQATDCGTGAFLKAGDAFYAAAAQLSKSQLITWDEEFAERAGGITPSNWLAANPDN